MRLPVLISALLLATVLTTSAFAQQDAAVYITASDAASFAPTSALSTTTMPGKWFQRNIAFAKPGDHTLMAKAGARYPDLTVTPGLRGRYNLYVNLRSVHYVTGLQLKLSGEELAHTVTPELGTEKVHTNRDILWATDVDLTDQTILMHYIGRVIYFSYLKFVPVAADRPDVKVDPERVVREPLSDVWDEWVATRDLVPEGMVELKHLQQQPATPAVDDGLGYVITTRPYLDLVFPHTIPAAADATSVLSLAATRDEYEPVTFSVHAFRDLGSCEVSVGDLTNGQDTIPQAAIDVAWVACRNLRTSFRGKVFMNAPALLQSGSPVEIPAGRTQQFWLTVHVPPQTPAGDYTGAVTVRPQDAPVSELELTLRVYPFDLREPQDVSLGMYDGMWSSATGDAWLRDRFADMRAHGMTSVGYSGGLNGTIEMVDGVAQMRFDGTSGFEKIMEAYSAAGFPRPLLWLMGAEPWSWCNKQAEPGSEQSETLYRQVIQSLLQRSEERGWPGIVFQPVDEPGSYGLRDSAGRIESWVAQSRLIKQAGGVVEVDHIPFSTEDPRLKTALESVLPSIDIFTQRFATKPIWFKRDGWGWSAMHEQVDEWGKQLWSYNINNANFFPELPTMRLAYGVFVWQQQVRGQMTWSYQAPTGNPLNCLDGGYTDMMYTYPAMPRANVQGGPSLMWECLREGVDDLRYVQTLEHAIQQAKADGKHELAQQARAVLMEMAASFDTELLNATNNYIECRWDETAEGTATGSFNIPNGWELDDYDRWRSKIAEQIIRLTDR